MSEEKSEKKRVFVLGDLEDQVAYYISSEFNKMEMGYKEHLKSLETFFNNRLNAIEVNYKEATESVIDNYNYLKKRLEYLEESMNKEYFLNKERIEQRQVENMTFMVAHQEAVETLLSNMNKVMEIKL